MFVKQEFKHIKHVNQKNLISQLVHDIQEFIGKTENGRQQGR